MHCPVCAGPTWKAGIQRGKQRYKCKTCGYHFTQSMTKNYPPEMHQKAVALYLEGLGFRAIGRLLGGQQRHGSELGSPCSFGIARARKGWGCGYSGAG